MTQRNRLNKTDFKYIRLFLIVIILIIFPLGMGAYYYLSDLLETESKQNSKNMLNQLNSAVEILLKEVDKSYIQLALDPSINDFKNDNLFEGLLQFNIIQKRMDEVINVNPTIKSIYIYYYNENVVLSSNKGILKLEEFFDKEIINEVLEGKKSMGWQSIRRVNSSLNNETEKLLTSIRPVPINMISKKAIIFINNRSDFLDEIITNISLSKDAGISVYSENWQPITSYGIDSKLVDSIYKEMDKSPDIFNKKIIDGKKYYLFHQTSLKYKWNYVVNIPVKTINKNAEFVRSITIWVCALLFFISLFISYIFSKGIRKNIDVIENKNKNLEDLLNLNKPIMQVAFLKNLLNGVSVDSEEIDERLSYYEMSDMNTKFSICFISYIENYLEYVDKYSERQKVSYSVYIKNLVEGIIKAKYNGFIIENDFDEFSIVVNFIGVYNYDILNKEIKEIVEDIYKIFIQDTKFNVFIAVGDAVEGIHNIHTSYLQAREALRNRWRVVDNIIYFSNLSGTMKNVYSYYERIEEKLVYSISNNEKESCLLIVNDLKEWIEKYNTIEDTEKIDYVFIQIIAGISKMLFIRGINVSELTYRKNIFERLNMAKTLEDRINIIYSYAIYCIEYINSLQINKNSKIISKIKAYINDNFNKENLGLEDISSNVFLSSQYISKLFKEETAENIKEYIIKIRIENAKESLMNTNKKIVQISEEVGYDKTQTFTKIFKKYVGMTPGEYREKN